MIIAVPSEDSFLKYVSNGIFDMPPHHVTRWSDDTLKFISKHYNLEVVEIYHEKIQPIHKRWFITTVLSRAFGSSKMIDLKLHFKLINRFLSLIATWIEKGFEEEMLPNGIM